MARLCKVYWPCCLVTLAAAASLGVWHSRTSLQWLPAARSAPQAPVTSQDSPAADGSAVPPSDVPPHDSASTAANAEPGSAPAAGDAGSQSLLENPATVPAAPEARAAEVITAVPPSNQRLFGPALPRMAIYGGTDTFEPEAYRRCDSSSFLLDNDAVCDTPDLHSLRLTRCLR